MRNRPRRRFNFAKNLYNSYTLTTNYLIMSRLGNYLRDTKTEIKHVSWPTHHQAVIFTVLVIAISAAVAMFVGAADYVFTGLLDFVI